MSPECTAPPLEPPEAAEDEGAGAAAADEENGATGAGEVVETAGAATAGAWVVVGAGAGACEVVGAADGAVVGVSIGATLKNWAPSLVAAAIVVIAAVGEAMVDSAAPAVAAST